jgi:hypothetical protein
VPPHLLQAVPFFELPQPAIAQFQPFVFGNSNQVGEFGLFLTKDLSGKQNPLTHHLQNPKVHHLQNLRVLSLSSSLGFLVILVDFFFPLLTPFNLFFEPTQDQWLFEFKM